MTRFSCSENDHAALAGCTAGNLELNELHHQSGTYHDENAHKPINDDNRSRKKEFFGNEVACDVGQKEDQTTSGYYQKYPFRVLGTRKTDDAGIDLTE